MGAVRAALALAGAAVLLAAGPGAAKGDLVATDDGGFNPRFLPAEVRVQPGEEVVVTNAGSDRHTVTSVDGAWAEVELGSREVKSFAAPPGAGEFRFYCRYHASPSATAAEGMAGSLVVGGAAAKPAPLPGGLAALALGLGAAAVAGRRRKA